MNRRSAPSTASLRRLGLDYVDLYLIHWPVPAKSAYLVTWKALEEICASGRARAIGVSNFQPWHLQPLLDRHEIVPAVNQFELHPAFQQEEVRAFDQAHSIVTQAWSPLAQGEVLADPVITALSRKYGKTPAQIVLRWHVELGNVVVTKSVTPSRIKENIDIFDFSLAAGRPPASTPPCCATLSARPLPPSASSSRLALARLSH